MKCPVCTNTDLAITDRQGIEIDYCPRCRGVWLDRGELDKIIERSAAYVSPEPGPEREPEPRRPPKDKYYDRDHDDRDRYYRGKKKKSFLSEIFDFD